MAVGVAGVGERDLRPTAITILHRQSHYRGRQRHVWARIELLTDTHSTPISLVADQETLGSPTQADAAYPTTHPNQPDRRSNPTDNARRASQNPHRDLAGTIHTTAATAAPTHGATRRSASDRRRTYRRCPSSPGTDHSTPA